jgi:hypothetical protein
VAWELDGLSTCGPRRPLSEAAAALGISVRTYQHRDGRQGRNLVNQLLDGRDLLGLERLPLGVGNSFRIDFLTRFDQIGGVLLSRSHIPPKH